MSDDADALVDEVPVDPATARVYAEGWQSWSPATWYAATATGRVPAETWEHLMRFRPGTPVTAEGVQGEGLVVVDPGTGAPARCYGTTDPVAVPTIRTTAGRRPAAGAQHRPGRRHRAPGRRERARRLRRRPRRRGAAAAPAAHRVVLLVPLLRGGHGRRRPRGRARPRRARPRRRRGAGGRRVEPRSRRGAAARGAVRIAGARGGRGAGLGPPGRHLAGTVPRRCRHHPGPRAPRLAGRAGRQELGTAPRRPRPHPPRCPGAAGRRTATSPRPGCRLPQARLPVRRRGARPAPGGRRPGQPPTERASGWCATWWGPTSTWWAVVRRSCRASASSTPCGSPRTPSTRAARTARPDCAG